MEQYFKCCIPMLCEYDRSCEFIDLRSPIWMKKNNVQLSRQRQLFPSRENFIWIQLEGLILSIFQYQNIESVRIRKTICFRKQETARLAPRLHFSTVK